MSPDLLHEEFISLERRARWLERMTVVVAEIIRADERRGRIAAEDARMLARIATSGAMPTDVVDRLLSSSGVPECAAAYGAAALAIARWTDQAWRRRLEEADAA